MTDPHPNPDANDRTDPPAAVEDATETSGAGYGNHPPAEEKPTEK